MITGPALTLAFVGPDEAAAVRGTMLAAFAEYQTVLTVPSSAIGFDAEEALHLTYAIRDIHYQAAERG